MNIKISNTTLKKKPIELLTLIENIEQNMHFGTIRYESIRTKLSKTMNN